MSMEPKKLAPPKDRSRRMMWSGAVVLVIFLVLGAIVMPQPQETGLVWLDPSALTHPALPNAFVRLRNRLFQIAAPVWGRFIRNRPNIHTDANIFTMTAATADKLNLGGPVSTNAGGLRAWILSPEQMTRFNQLVKNQQPGINSISRPRIQSGDGGQAQLGMTQGLPLQATGSLNPAAGTKYVQIGTVIDLIPKIRAKYIGIKLAVSQTETNGWSPDGYIIIKTNLSLACRAMIASGGGLILEGGRGTNENDTNYWFALSPTAVDARGVSIMLR